jgi:phospholipid transport system substrate-binding protein
MMIKQRGRGFRAIAAVQVTLMLGCSVAWADAPPPTSTASTAKPVAASARTPQEMMTKVAHDLFTALDDNRAKIRADHAAVFPLVDKILLPEFDAQYAARLVLGNHWRTATEEQRERFVKALYNALLKVYGGAISDFTADRLQMLPFVPDQKNPDKEAIVRTIVKRDSGALVHVDYRVHMTNEGWKAYDVIIEGISYVTNYRTDFGAEIDQKGLDELITRLEKEGLHYAMPGGKKEKDKS